MKLGKRIKNMTLSELADILTIEDLIKIVLIAMNDIVSLNPPEFKRTKSEPKPNNSRKD